MIEIHKTDANHAVMWEEGVQKGRAGWSYRTLEFGRERVIVAILEDFSAENEVLENFFMAYLHDQFKQNAAAAWQSPAGEMAWYSKALEALYQKSLG